MRFFLSLLLVITAVFSYGQELFIDWGPGNKTSSPIYSIHADEGLDFYAYRQSGGQLIQSPKISHYVDGVPVTTKKVEQRIGDRMVNLERVITFGGTLLCFHSDKRDGNASLFMVKYDTEIDPYAEPQLMVSYPLPKGWGNRGKFNLITSPNRKYLCVEYIIPGKRDLFDRYGYKVIDSNFALISEGEYELPYSSDKASVDIRYLTDNGEYILGISIIAGSSSSPWRDYSTIEKTIVVQVSRNELFEYEMSIVDKKVFEIGMGSLDSMLIITGTYGQPYSSGAEGTFVQKIDLASRKVVHQSFEIFPQDFMTKSYTDFQLERLERNEYSVTLNPQLMNYAIRSVYPLADGSTVVLAEQLYVFAQNSSDFRGLPQSVYHYYFNDLIVYKIDSLGAFSWITDVPKEQHSINDNGYYSSIISLVSNGKLNCFFNDNLRNYDETGMYEGFYRSAGFPMRKASYAFALAQIDLETGEVERRVFNDYDQSNGMIVTRLSAIDLSRKEVLMFSSGNKEQFGIMKF